MFRNMFILYGRLTRDVDVKTIDRDNGEQLYVASIGLAVNRPRRANQDVETDFFYLTAFGKTAENISKYFSKGDRIGVTGHIQLDEYTSNDGERRSRHKFIVDDFEFIETKREKEQRGACEYAEQAISKHPPSLSQSPSLSQQNDPWIVNGVDILNEDDDLPF